MVFQHRNFMVAVSIVVCVLLASVAYATEWDLAADFSSTANPSGQWSYGTLNNGVFDVYMVQESPGANGSVFAGWHMADGWDNQGSIGKNLGPNPIDGWGFYTEVGDCRVQGSNTAGNMPGARWTCPADGKYLYTARFTATWYNDPGYVTNVEVAQNATTVLASGTVDGFIGRAVNNYTDGNGTVRERTYAGFVDLVAGETLEFVGGGTGAYGHCAGIDVHVMPAAGLGCEVSGHVADEHTLAAIEGATITTSDGSFSTTTDGSGYYQFTVPAGSVTLSATAPGYAPGDPKTITAPADGNVSNVDFVLNSNGALFGTVTSSANGYGIEGAVVRVGSESTLTDFYGSYYIEVNPGTYPVTISAGGYVKSATAAVEIGAGMAVDKSVELTLSTVADLAADFENAPAANPCGVWTYGHVSTWDGFIAYDTTELAIPGTGDGIFTGWHTSAGWDASGNLGKNTGTDPIDYWDWYAEIGQLHISTAPDSTLTGARWWCPADGQYRIYATWTGQSTVLSEDIGSVMLLKNLDSNNPLAQGTVNGFVGRKANNYADRVVDGAGTSTEAHIQATVDCLAWETIEIVSSAANGPQGHCWGLNAIVMPVSSLGTISGTVTLSGTSTPVPGARVSTMNGSLSVATDSNGYYTMDVPAGSWQVTVEQHLCDAQTVPVSVVAQGSTTQSFELVVARAQVSGQVTSAATGLPIPYAVVQTTDGSARVLADTDGNYAIVVAAGSSLTVTGEHYTGQQLSNVQPDGLEPITADFVLPRAFTYDVALDFSSTVNPNGTWRLGYRQASDGAWVDFDTPDSATAGGTLYGWHTPQGWDAFGSIGLNSGPTAILAWGRYQEVGQIVVQPSAQGVGEPAFENDGTGTRWTCPETGYYLVHARFTAQSAGGYEGLDSPATVNVRKNGTALHSGVIDGFVGSLASNFSDEVVVNAVPTQIAWEDTLSLTAGDTIDFLACYPNATWDAGRVTAIDAGVSKVDVIPTPVPSIADLKAVADGTLVTITTPVVATAATGNFTSGKLYAEDTDRVAGIKVLPGTASVTVLKGDRLTITGVVGKDANNDRCITAQSITVTETPGTPIRALGMPGKTSAASGSLVPGLLVTVWGRVTARTTDYIYLDDGSGLPDSTGNTGIRVSLSDIATSGSAPSQSYILVSGVLGKTTVGTTVVPTIYPTIYADLQGLTE